MGFKEAEFLDDTGRLTSRALEYKRNIKLKDKLRNEAVINKLTKGGYSIEEWRKYTTPKVMLPTGKEAQIHFYYNMLTNEVSYTIDYKIKEIIGTFTNNMSSKATP